MARVAWLFALVALLGAPGCTSDEEQFAAHMEAGAELAEAENWKEALVEYRSALQLDPKNAEVNFRIAELLQEVNRLADAAFFYRETTRLDPSRTDAAMAEAKLILFDDTARASELVERVIELEPGNALAHVRRSEIALANADSAGALEAALTARELDPSFGLAHMQIGIVQQARIREMRLEGETPDEAVFEQAVRAFRKADELFGGGMQARAELGRLYATWPGHDEEAEAAYRSAVEVADPGEERGRAAGATLSYARAVRNRPLRKWALEVMVREVPSNLPAWDELAAMAEGQEEGSGDEVYRRLLEQRPQDIEAHVRFARFMTIHGRGDEGIAHLWAQVDAGVEPAVALEEISALHLSKADLPAAREVIARLEDEYPDHVRTALARGRLAFAERRFDDAAELLRRYVGSEQRVAGQRLLAMTELRRRNYPAAVAAIDTALQVATGPTRDLERLKVQIHRAARDWVPVIATLRRVARSGARLNPGEQVILAEAFYETGRERLGRRTLEQVLQGDDVPLGAYIEFARREGSREPDRAREYLAQVLEENPRNPVALQGMTELAIEAGRPEEALAHLQRAAEAGPLRPALLLLRANVHVERESWEEAEEDARRAFAADPGLVGALDLLARIYTMQGRLEEAISSFSEAAAVGALPAQGQVLLARLLLAAGRREEAVAAYEKVLAVRSDLAGAKNDLAWLMAEKGDDLERALQLAQEAQQAMPDSPSIADTLGFVYHRKGLNEAALQQFDYAIELAQRDGGADAQLHYHRGLALLALGRHGDAAGAFETALGLDESFPNAEDARRQLEAARASAASQS